MWPTQRNWDCSKNASVPEMTHISSTWVFDTRSCHLIPAILRRQRMWNCSSCLMCLLYRVQHSEPNKRVVRTTARIHHVRATAGAGVHRRLYNPWLFLPWCCRPLRLCSTGSKICWRTWGSYHRPWLWQLQTGLWGTIKASPPSF